MNVQISVANATSMFASIGIIRCSIFDVTVFILNKLQYLNFLQKPHCLTQTAQKGA